MIIVYILDSSKNYDAVTSVPSFTNSKVEKFARQVAEEIGIPYLQLLEKVPGQQANMKNMQNSYYQYKNAISSFQKKDGTEVPKQIILIDDIVDSKWTLTVCGRLLTSNGAEKVVPFCLADSSLALGD